jgi:hypothetical protein
MKMRAVAIVVAVLTWCAGVAGCVSPAPPELPGAGHCLLTSLGTPAAPLYVTWNGHDGATVNLSVFSDPACTTLNPLPALQYRATVAGPSVAVPPSVGGFWDLPPDDAQTLSSPFASEAASACRAIFDPAAIGQVGTFHVATLIRVPNSIPVDLWACSARSISGATLPQP